jgi:pyruvate formate-lyase/glycerol dehydratase family glycyl radical enzyme
MDKVTLKDVSLKDITLKQLDRLARMRERHFYREGHLPRRPEICTELPRNITHYLQKMDQEEDPPEVRAGKLYKYVLENKTAIIAEENLLAGTTTSKTVGVLLHPDLYALVLWPELETMTTRKANPFGISKKDIDILNREVFPFWMDRTVMEVTRHDHQNPAWMHLMERMVFYMASKGITISHTIPDYGVVVKRGLEDLRADARKGLEAAQQDHDEERQSFYQGVDLALEGIISYAQRLSRTARELAEKEALPRRRAELQKISEICQWVPAQAPRTFWEALNAIWICKIALHQENGNFALSLGRLDQILYPLYAQDISRGELTVPQAVELVGCFWLSIADHVPISPEAAEELLGGTGSNQAITLGGVDREGMDAVNDLTYVMLKATELLTLRDPNVNARYHYDRNPKEYLERLCQVNMTTKATPCFHNDVSVIQSLQHTFKDQDITLEDARDYGVVGCVEPFSAGRTYGHSGAVYLNLTAALELALSGGKHRLTEDEEIGPKTTPLENLTTWEDFKEALETQIDWLIGQAVTFNNCAGLTHLKIHRTPMLSALMAGCLAKGQDVICGGATYNASGATIIGLAEVVDSVTAIQEFVFNKKTISPAEMREAINTNWQGKEEQDREKYKKLHAWVQHSKEKFGRESLMAKDNADWLMGFMEQDFRRRPNYRNGNYTTGYWTMTMHAGLGRITKALPSGRQDWESFASGITPVSGSAPQLTPCLNFVGGLDYLKVTNGQALNIKYFPATATVPAFAHTIEAYFKGQGGHPGGIQVQFNIIDREMLKDMMLHPKDYPPLMVRVSGYTAYFQDLNPQMQQEIITRAEYDLVDGLEHRYQDQAPEEKLKSMEKQQSTGILGDLREFLFGWSARRRARKFVQGLDDEVTEELLQSLLSLMKLAFWLDRDYAKCIKDFTGSYRFKDRKGGVNVFVKFHDGEMKFTDKDHNSKADVTVTFKNSEALLNFLLGDFGDNLQNFMLAGGNVLGNILHLDFGRGLRDFLLAHNQAFKGFLLAFKKDILKLILENAIQVDGNLNYLYRFGFLANHPIRQLLNLANKVA